MFVSPCTLRSAQCAALIALATAAGIARVEQTEPAAAADRDAVRADTAPLAGLAQQFFALPSPLLARWSQSHPWLVLARWVLTGDSHSPRGPVAASATMPAPAPEETAGACASVLPPAVEKILFARATFPALCTEERRLPFAVGPPARSAIANPNAGDTFVSCNTTARGMPGSLKRIASRARVAAEARLAREICPGRKSAGFAFPTRAQRGQTDTCGSLELRNPPAFAPAPSARASLTALACSS